VWQCAIDLSQFCNNTSVRMSGFIVPGGLMREAGSPRCCRSAQNGRCMKTVAATAAKNHLPARVVERAIER
jgi:hypothetical protein